MKSRYAVIFALTLLGSISIFCVKSLYNLRPEKLEESIGHFSSLNKDLAKSLTFEFHGLASDYHMLKTLTFMGEKIIAEKQLTPKEWQLVYLALKQVVNLDPRFIDPYVVAEMSLPWEGGMVEETNELLKVAIEARPEDYRPLFFLWYNYFYFLKDVKTAAFYLQQAAQKPSAPAYYGTLAARMHLYSGELQNSVIFLKEMIGEATDPKLKKQLELRLDVTTKIAFLEHKIKIFREQHQRPPQAIEELVSSGILQEIPVDPYGGKFYIMENGRVYTTSEMVSKKISTKPPILKN